MTELLEKRDLISSNISVSPEGHLLFAGSDTVELAKKYGTPLYLLDEDRIRENCRTYIQAANEAFGGRYKIMYASKALSFKRIYEIMKEEKMGIDVVSTGEIFTAFRAGFPLSKAYFHSNNKTDEDIAYAIENGVGYFVADNAEELFAVDREARRKGIVQKILIRVTPGVDPHTYAAISTGKVDSKFGAAIETGQAEQLIKTALSLGNLSLKGFHCHVGSQVFDSDVYIKTADIMLTFIAGIKDKYGYMPEELDLGGGFGVRYIKEQPENDIAGNILTLGDFMQKKAEELAIELPIICFEPGRSIVGDAGLTLYTAGTVKEIPGFKTYVSVDGGMTDNARYALYKAPYTLFAADDMNADCDMVCSVVGRCCESGDIIQPDVALPSDIKRGCKIAVLTTGAYNYSMASNYNRLPRPAMVMIKDGEDRLVVRRESLDDIVRNDI